MGVSIPPTSQVWGGVDRPPCLLVQPWLWFETRNEVLLHGTVEESPDAALVTFDVPAGARCFGGIGRPVR